MNKLIEMLKPWLSSAAQLVFVAALIITAVIFYSIGAGQRSGQQTSEMKQTSSSEQQSRSSSSDSIDQNGDGVIFTCSMHPQIKQDDPGDCPICGMDLVEQEVADAGPESPQSASKPSQNKEPSGYACAMNCVPPLPEEGECPICGMEMQPVYDDSGGLSEEARERLMTMSEEARALANIQTETLTRMPAIRTVRLVGQLAIDPSRRVHISADVGGRIDRLYAEFEGDVVTKGQDLVLFYSPELLAVQQEFLQAAGSLERLSPNALTSHRESSRMAVEAARERLRLAGLSPLQVDELADANQAKVSVMLKAPIGGTVIARHSEEGEYVNKGEHIVTIADLTRLWGEFEAHESDLIWLRTGQPATFTTKARPGETFTGDIAYIDPILTPSTRTTRVRINIDNATKTLKPGMYVTGLIEATLYDGAPQLIVPESAPLITGQRAVAYVEVPGGDRPRFVGREIELGPRTKDGYVVASGLVEGERVVTHGAFQIDSALQIVAKPSMMNPEGGRVSTGHEGHGADMTDMPMPGREPAADSISDSTDEAIGHSMLKRILPIYLEIQRSLAEDDFAASREHWLRLRSQWSDSPSYMREGSDAENIIELRTAFQHLSDALITAVREHGNPYSETLKLARCPMAFDWSGADWLQTEDVINNSYFGDEMLTCGVFNEEFPPHD